MPCTRAIARRIRSIIFLVPDRARLRVHAPLDQVITFSILSGLLGYTFMSFNMWMFRRKWPLGSIKRGYVHPFHPLPAHRAAAALHRHLLRGLPGLRHQLVAMMVFYIIASLWFAFHRYKYVKRGDQFTMAWPRPLGY